MASLRMSNEHRKRKRMVLQVYMYTHTGLMDKKSNWFTHFIGMFLRPKDFMVTI